MMDAGVASCVMRRVPQAWFGLLLLLIFWPLNWVLEGNRTAYLFFPLWLGYVLVVDGMVFIRSGTSQWVRSKRDFVLLFFASAPAWWLFELINWRTNNWEYVGSSTFSTWEYVLLCTISFSTVMPAVFETAELARTFGWIDRVRWGLRIEPTRGRCVLFLVIGLVMLGLVLGWPGIFYPLVWGSIVMILDPVNFWRGRPAFLHYLRVGEWRPVIALSVGALICGFFWEMWNYYSYPKWIYHTPGAEFLYVFEMPLLGYIGYLPFAWELFALRSLLLQGAGSLRL